MPHINYCQQCGKSVEPRDHDKRHNVIPNVAQEQASRGHKKNEPVKPAVREPVKPVVQEPVKPVVQEPENSPEVEILLDKLF